MCVTANVPSGGTSTPLLAGSWWVVGVLGCWGPLCWRCQRAGEPPRAPFCPQVLPEQPYPCRAWWFGASRVDGMDAWCLPLQLCGGFWGEQSQPSWKHLRGCWVPPALGSLGCRRTEGGDIGDPHSKKPPGFWWHLLINAVGPARFPGHPLWAGCWGGDRALGWPRC